MPYSLVINFTNTSDIPRGYTSGKHLHALFLSLVNSIAPKLSEYLHRSQSNKDFTISPLQITRNHNQNQLTWEKQKKDIKKGSNCWWRITLLDDNLFGKLTPLWLNINPQKPFHLGSGELQIISILSSNKSHPWANACSYQEIYETASESDRNLNFKIYTPTAFRQGKNDLFLPTAEIVFSSLLRKWNKYSNLPLENISFQDIYPSLFDIKTEIIFNETNKFIGCVGDINYKILGETDSSLIRSINILADYAFYSGIGRKTTMGLGIIKRQVKS
jgi:CRISPR-associated endoribonuclease Cas6